jgi:hypothetical protein
MKDCPLEVECKTEFTVKHDDLASNLEFTFGVGEDAPKTSCQSFIDIDADEGMAYPLDVSVKMNGKWYTQEVTAVRVRINGEYEKYGFMYALQKAGLMTLPFYGKMKSSEELWEEENAIRKQT